MLHPVGSVWVVDQQVDSPVSGCVKRPEYFRVNGRSMWPVLPPGSVVRLRQLNPGEPLSGQVVCFTLFDRLVLHRVVWLLPGGFVARGDASAVFDPPCHIQTIQGVVDQVFIPDWYPNKWFVAHPGAGLVYNLLTWPLVVMVHSLDTLWHWLSGR